MAIRTLFFALLVAAFATGAMAASKELLNVSYDPTRELYEDYNKLFAQHWKEKSKEDIVIKQSHGGSGKQARSVIDGLQADVVTLALAYDIDAIAERTGALTPDWQTKLPHQSSPYTSTIVFLVKKGNPKKIKDWNDLVNEGVEVITPNPKTSGGARWNYLAAYGYALEKNGKDEAKAQAFVKELFAHVPVLDTGARGATTTFAQRGIGDVLLAWENEALLTLETFKDQFEIVYPSVSILTEPPVAVVEKVAESKGTLDAAREYLTYLYSPEAQEIIAKHGFRPSDPGVSAKYEKTFPKVNLLTIKDFGGWKETQKRHFDEGGLYDNISETIKR